MKFELPDNHGLSQLVIDKLVFHEDGKPALTDAQFGALQTGVGRGDSMLVVSPTSTGKTQIAIWSIARSIQAGCTTVYLVTHRALAKQKFEEFKSVLLADFLGGNGSAFVLATGDYVEDAEGNIPAEPLRVPLLVATYEKYLAMLSASGIPADMTSTVIVCDEIQLIGDANRGQNVEVLLTLLRNAGWRQFVGLSAVLHTRDAEDLANWLQVRLVVEHAREKHLCYECWTPKGIAAVTSERADVIEEGLPIPAGVGLAPLPILLDLLNQRNPPLPIIVFCTRRKQDTYDLAEQLLAIRGQPATGQLSLAFDGLPETSANTLLAKALVQRIAIHNADLTDEERHVVEQHLLERKVDVVFATPTLAAGVNFPFGAAIFASWSRWDSDRRAYVAIESAEFHNMAGRVGRMGFEHEQGRVIFVAASDNEMRTGRGYLELGVLPSLEPRVAPSRFEQLVLQLVASGLCKTRDELNTLVCTTFSGLREEDRNTKAFAAWPGQLAAAVDSLAAKVLLMETGAGSLVATTIGRAIAHSGLLPDTGIYLINYSVGHLDSLIKLLPTADQPGDLGRLHYLICCVCFSSPEFRYFRRSTPTRFLPWPLEKVTLFDAEPLLDDLPEPVWQADLYPINAAKLSIDWIEGAELAVLERSLPQLSAGMLRDMYRNLVWVLQGFASVLTAAADKRTPLASKPVVLAGGDAIFDKLAKLPRIIRRLSFRVTQGLPEDVLWMADINSPGADFRLIRSEVLSLRVSGYIRPEQVMLGTQEANKARLVAFTKVKPAPQAKANWLRDACRDWKIDQRKRSAERHLKRARRCVNVKLVDEFYTKRGTDFEEVFESILGILGISFRRLDDKTKTGAPDYLLALKESPALVVELKSRDGDKLIDYNRAVEVLAASEVHGHKNAFCVTLCHPGVDPSVPLVIAACGRLSVVESSDLGEALLRMCEGSLSQGQLYAWLASPGQALAADLPFREYT
ncbi:DEAD/DEAH box helicase [Acidithiobacillus sulfuriphilus]|uniref:DEAD/DEAH box helicase n=1 Tax=Acidithiobacillus sulfuriphilus TaxID=1867749 RepID=UPI003F611BAB